MSQSYKGYYQKTAIFYAQMSTFAVKRPVTENLVQLIKGSGPVDKIPQHTCSIIETIVQAFSV